MKKVFKNMALWLALAPAYMFAASSGNVLTQFTQSANTQIQEAGSSVASIVNTISVTMGIIWIIIMLLMTFFNMEAIKNHSKLLFGALVIIGIVYGISASAM